MIRILSLAFLSFFLSACERVCQYGYEHRTGGSMTAVAVKSCSMAADAGDAKSQFVMSEAARNGWNVPRSAALADEWLGKAAASGHLHARAQSAANSLRDRTKNVDRRDAVATLEQAAKDGDALGQYELAQLYLAGRDVKKNVSTAAHWLILSSNQNFHPAEFLLSELFNDGGGVAKDIATAGRLLKRAAEGDYVPAFIAQGKALETGAFGNRDLVQAKAWYSKALESGESSAQRPLRRVMVKLGEVEAHTILKAGAFVCARIQGLWGMESARNVPQVAGAVASQMGCWNYSDVKDLSGSRVEQLGNGQIRVALRNGNSFYTFADALAEE